MKLDRLTQGIGNCFMVAVLQQLQRPEVHNNLLDDLKQMAIELDQLKLRRFVVEFIRQKEDIPKVAYMRERFAPNPQVLNGPKSWEEYWEKMLLDCNWADGDFVQATAWCLQHDLLIFDTSCTEQLPFIKISGNMNNEDLLLTNDDPLLIGTTTGTHFQSLLLDLDNINEHNLESYHITVKQHLMKNHLARLNSNEPPCKIMKVDIKTSSPSDEKCPNCKKVFKQLLQHIRKSKCNPFVAQEFIQHVESMSKEKTRLKNQMKVAKFRERKRTENHEALKKQQNQNTSSC